MKCMKCGREQESDQVFCNDCLLEMEKYPVSPNATVQLPLRRSSASRKAQPRRKAVPLEEQVKVLKKRLWLLTGILLVTLVLLIAMIHPTVNYFIRNYHLRPGQNYNTITPKTTVPMETTETVDPSEGMAE